MVFRGWLLGILRKVDYLCNTRDTRRRLLLVFWLASDVLVIDICDVLENSSTHGFKRVLGKCKSEYHTDSYVHDVSNDSITLIKDNTV